MTDVAALRREVDALWWYHTLELAPGVVTPGWFDTRTLPPALPFPTSLAGQRCLDVGTFDGFWAFEMERRGGEVVAVDVLDPDKWDWPVLADPTAREEMGRRKAAGRGFEVARTALGSTVVRHPVSVYDLDPAEVGEFDFVYVGSLLLHLRDPVRALERVRSVCRGTMLLVDSVDLTLSLRFPGQPVAVLDGLGRPWWWQPNVPGLARMVQAAGFRLQRPPQRVFMPPGAGQQLPPVRLRSLRRRAGWTNVITHVRGEPHAAVLAEPDR